MAYLARIVPAAPDSFKVYAGDPDLAPLLFCGTFSSEREAIDYAARIAGEYKVRATSPASRSATSRRSPT